MIQKRPDDQAPKKMAHQGKIAMEPKWSSGGLYATKGFLDGVFCV